MPKLQTQLDAPEKTPRPVAPDTLPEQPVKDGTMRPRQAMALMRMPEAGAPARARAATGLQQAVGNAKTTRAVEEHPIQRQPAGLDITISVPADARVSPEGEATLELAGVDVVIAPDTHSNDEGMRGRSKTGFSLTGDIPGYDYSGSKVTAVRAVPRPVMRIQTIYGPGATSQGPSAYGRGTTPEDIRAGRTTLGHHEGSHGTDFLEYLKDNPVPAFRGRAGMTRTEFNKAASRYRSALRKYKADLERFSEQRTDCVGKKASFCEKKPETR